MMYLAYKLINTFAICWCHTFITQQIQGYRHYIRAHRSWRGHTGILLSVCLSACLPACLPVWLSVSRRHGFRSMSQVCFEISFSNVMCTLIGAIARSLLIFSDVTFKMAAWRPYCLFCFVGFRTLTLALNINSKLHYHIICVYGY